MHSIIHKSIEDRDHGFSLIELLVVIITIGILAAVAIPVYLNQRKKGWDAGAKATLRGAATAQETYLAANSSYTTSRANLRGQGFRRTSGVTFTIISTRGAGSPAAGVDSYCLRAVSRSAAVFFFDSANGGLSTSACL